MKPLELRTQASHASTRLAPLLALRGAALRREALP